MTCDTARLKALAVDRALGEKIMTPETIRDAVFCRMLLKKMHADVRNIFPEITNLVQAASVTSTGRGQWFVQIVTPKRTLNWDGRAYNATDARYKAWGAFLREYSAGVLLARERALGEKPT